MKILKFEKEDCNACNLVEKYLVNNQIKFEAINSFDKPELAIKYKIRSLPTIIVINEIDKEIFRTKGFNEQELEILRKEYAF